MRKPARLAISVAAVGGTALLVWLIVRGGGGASLGRAALRVDRKGISTSSGAYFKSVDDAVAAVIRAQVSIVDVLVTGDAEYGLAGQLMEQLKKAGLTVYMQGYRG